ncbi:hypothetical protein [Rhodococcus sp. MEB064]|uniref:hypothetical protein n=1 Tax=Rhodococcus sp. MEB064 TaxID=1587522 RepID=UPI0005ACCC57|nr:hypothetical protein [Rhodococcus sp. MEB064]KIQ18456.1 hypothetical protein RU01_07755 [Rhodococcus sp. MEB064]
MVFAVRAPSLMDAEIFTDEGVARLYASTIAESSIVESPLRTSLDGADLIVERTVVVSAGQVVADSTRTTWNFRDPGTSAPGVDVESYRCRSRHWHILGFGSDESAVFSATRDAVQRAINDADVSVVVTASMDRNRCA